MIELGFRGRSDWSDMSDYVVHFTKDTERNGIVTEAYFNMMGILGEGVVQPGPLPFGCARDIPTITETQRSACFSAIPLGKLDRLVKQRQTCYGIAFTKEFMLAQGGAPVWYVESDSAVQMALGQLKEAATSGGVSVADPLWRITPFVDHPGDYPYCAYRFEWEREWRCPGGVRFSPENVAFLLIEEDLHAAARGFFENAVYENTGPGYFCPYVDPRWDQGRVEIALQR